MSDKCPILSQTESRQFATIVGHKYALVAIKRNNHKESAAAPPQYFAEIPVSLLPQPRITSHQDIAPLQNVTTATFDLPLECSLHEIHQIVRTLKGVLFSVIVSVAAVCPLCQFFFVFRQQSAKNIIAFNCDNGLSVALNSSHRLCCQISGDAWTQFDELVSVAFHCCCWCCVCSMPSADAPLPGFVVASLMITSSTCSNFRPVPFTDSCTEGVVGASHEAASYDLCPMTDAQAVSSSCFLCASAMPAHIKILASCISFRHRRRQPTSLTSSHLLFLGDEERGDGEATLSEGAGSL
jgi:hypothetical protein